MNRTQIVKRMLAALGGGLVITFLPLLCLAVFKAFRARNPDPTDITALKIVLWPMTVLGMALPQNTPLAVTIIAGLGFTVLLYSLLTYLVMIRRFRSGR